MDIEKTRGFIFFISGIVNLAFAFFLWYNGKSKATFHLALTAFFSALFAFAFFGLFISRINKLFWLKTSWLGSFILSSYFIFVYYFTGRTKHIKIKLILWYLAAFIISCLAIFTSYIVSFHQPEYPYNLANSLTLLQFLLRIYIVIVLSIGLFYLLKEYFKSKGFKRLQFKYVIYGLVIYGIGAIFSTVVIPLVSPETGIYVDLAVIFSLPWIALTVYAIFKKKLFEVEVILAEILVFVMAIALLVFPFLMPTFLLKIVALAIFILFCFFGHYLIETIYKEMRQREKIARFKNISDELKEKLSQFLDLENVVSWISDVLMENFNIDKISFALKQPVSQFYEFHGSIGFFEKEIVSLIRDTHLCVHLEETKKSLARIEPDGELRIIQEKMKQNRIDLLFPLFQKNKLIGIMFLGREVVPFKKEEVEILEYLRYQISILLQNSLLYQEIKKDKDILERFYKKTIDRESKITELKQKILELEKKLEGGGTEL